MDDDERCPVCRERDRTVFAESALAAANARAERAAARIEATLTDACRMSAILLMAGEMTTQERRTARAVADGLAFKVRTALAEATTETGTREGEDV